MNINAEKFTFEFLEDTVSINQGSTTLTIAFNQIVKVRIFAKNALAKFLGNLFLELDVKQNENVQTITISAIHEKRIFGHQIPIAKGEEKLVEFASELHKRFGEMQSPPKIILGRVGTIWFNRSVLGLLIAMSTLTPVLIFVLWFFEPTRIVKPWAILPGCLALVVILFRERCIIVHSFRSRELDPSKLEFTEIRKLM